MTDDKEYLKEVEAQNDQLRAIITALVIERDCLISQEKLSRKRYKELWNSLVSIIAGSSIEAERSRPRHTSPTTLEGSTYAKFMFVWGRNVNNSSISKDVQELLEDAYKEHIEATIKGMKGAWKQGDKWGYMIIPTRSRCVKKHKIEEEIT